MASKFTLDLPSFQQDPYYQQSQNVLFPFASNILQGNIPDFYSGIGQTNSPQFQAALAMANRDTANQVSQGMVSQGIGDSGIANTATAQAVANSSTNARYQDYLNSIQGQEFLMGTGIGTMQGVGSAALSNQGQENQYNISKAGLGLQTQQLNQQEEQQKASMWSSILSSGVGALGNIFGMSTLGNILKPQNTAIGSASGGGNVGGVSGMGLDFTSGFGGF